MDRAQESFETYYRKLADQRGPAAAAARASMHSLNEVQRADDAVREGDTLQARRQLGRLRRRLRALRSVLDS